MLEYQRRVLAIYPEAKFVEATIPNCLFGNYDDLGNVQICGIVLKNGQDLLTFSISKEYKDIRYLWYAEWKNIEREMLKKLES